MRVDNYWPESISRKRRDIARFRHRLNPMQVVDVHALEAARQLQREREYAIGIKPGSFSEQIFSNTAPYSAFSTSAAEGSLLSGLAEQPWVPGGYFDGPNAYGKTLVLKAKGVFSNTGTPTLIFQWRMGNTLGPTYLSGGSVGVSAAITTGSGVSGVQWESSLELQLKAPGLGTGNATLQGCGWVKSPAGFAAPYEYAVQPTAGTFTQTFDASLTQYFNLSVTWSASSSSNTITCVQLLAYMMS